MTFAFLDRLRPALPLYVVLLLALTAAGVVNQRLYAHQLALLDRKQELQTEVADLRERAAAVNGPLAVTTWAEAHGMVPAPEADTLVLVAPAPAPTPRLPETGLEIRTIWR